MITEELRSYEVSLWTLQDEFITVLKWSNVEQDGRIKNPQMKLNVDGTQTLSFDIPMYLYYQEDSSNPGLVKRENPIWYNARNKNLINSMHKIKVIFNKDLNQSSEERSHSTFEFLITKVTETHEKDQMTCHVECEGLAFHELGKIGYNITLSQDTFILDKKDWDETGHWTKYDGTISQVEPIENVQYWCEQCSLQPVPSNIGLINPTAWYYDIQMNWGSFNTIRANNIVYENEYVSSWTNELIPQTLENAREKARPIDVKESNIYNITQTIAETFQVYCKYEYGYDDNYHIISKKVIFYNNYLDEENIISFTYPYSASKISRDMDATGLTTKMYVRPQDDDAVVSGKITIADCSANKTKEDYLMNFDYLYMIGGITKEQYEAIPEFEKKVRELNINLEDLSLQLAAKEKEKIKAEADAAVAEASMQEALKQIDYNEQLYKNLDENDGTADGYFTRSPRHPYSTLIKTDATGRNYVTLSDEDPGVPWTIDDVRNIHLYKVYDSSNAILNATWAKWTAGTSYGVGARVYYQPSSNDDEIGYTGLVCKQAHTASSPFDLSKWDRINVWPEWKANTAYKVNNQVRYGETAYVCISNHTSSSTFNSSKWITNLLDDYIDTNNIVKDEYGYVKELNFNNNFTLPANLSKYVYLTYRYSPTLYCDKVNEIFIQKRDDSEAVLDEATQVADSAKSSIETLESSYDQMLANKRVLIQKFNAMMGPALREGYWQPEDYQDYGDNKTITSSAFGLSYNASKMINDTGSDAAIGWDSLLFDGEDDIYFEESILLDKKYYPCIILTSSNLSQIATWLTNNKHITFYFNNNYYKTYANSQEANLLQNLTRFQLGGDMRLGFVIDKNLNNTTIKPVLVLTGAKDMSDDQIAFMSNRNQGNPRLGIFDIETVGGKATANIEGSPIEVTVTSPATMANYMEIKPRIKISSNELHTSSLNIKYNGQLLENYKDYFLNSRNTTRNDKAYFEYFITIKPDILFKTNNYNAQVSGTYTLSNAATCIYLDAQDVMIDSSKPKASYQLSINALNENFLRTNYSDLARIIMVNDSELKFENVFGYISSLELNLDKPWEDQIEVKNYKTKFEDLFSMIVASSEALKRNGAAFNAAANGEIPLSSEALATTIDGNSINKTVFQAYLDSGFDSSQVVKDKLTEIFNEAALILKAANESIQAVHDLNIKNAGILAGFVENIAADLTPHIVTSKTQPKDFKVGDVWNQIDDDGNIIGRYVATTSSSSAAGGYTRTFDGTLAAIKGAALNIDAAAGTLEILAENRIDMKSGGNIYIAANENVDIVGNKAVNIGGTTINIASASANGSVGGINIVASVYNDIDTESNLISKVLIHPNKIEMGAADIIMRGANKIQMITSRGSLNSTSALSISPGEGVWIGSGQGVRLYAGNITVTENNDGTFSPVNGTGASVELLPTHLLMGVSNTTGGTTAIEMTDSYLVIAAGNQSRTKEVTGTSSGLVGAKFQKNSIGLAVTTDGVTTAMLMDKNGFTVGSAGINVTTDNLRDINNGSYTRISKEGIELGSLADLYINTNNFKLQTHSREKGNNNSNFKDGETIMAIGSNLQGINESTTVGESEGDWHFYDANSQKIVINGAEPNVRLLVNKNGLYIKGNIYAQDGYFSGTLYANNIKINDGQNTRTWDNYWAQVPLDYMATVESTIGDIFTEASTILGAAAQSLSDVNNLTVTNSTILNTFKQKIAAQLTPNTSKGPYHEWYFKTGDIWNKTAVTSGQTNLDDKGRQKPDSGSNANPYASSQIIGTYIAMQNWDEVYTSKTAAQNGKAETKGWNRTADGRLADIKGAAIDIDTQAGELTIKAQHSLSLLCNGTIDISGKDVEITGSKSIKMGSASIELGTSPNNEETTSGHIYLVNTWKETTNGTTSYGTNKVMLDSTGIEIAAKKGIVIKSGDGIDIYASEGNNTHTSAVRINKEDGVWIGSGKAINLSATSSVTDGSNFSMTPDYILIGVTGTNQNITQTSAIDITKEQIILAVGSTNNKFSDYTSGNITDGATLAGVQIKSNYIGLATGTGTSTTSSRSLISITPEQILIGVAKKGTADNAPDVTASNLTESNITNNRINGGYIKISNTGTAPVFEIGSTGVFKVLTPTLKIDSSATTTTTMMELKKGSDTVLAFSQTNGLIIKGKITATSGTIGGCALGSSFLGIGLRKNSSGNDYAGTSAYHYTCGISNDQYYVFWAGAPNDLTSNETEGPKNYDRDDALFRVTPNGKLYASDADISGKITATSGIIGGCTLGSTFLGIGLRKNSSDNNYAGIAAFHYACGISNDSSYVFWAGVPNDLTSNQTGGPKSYNRDNAPFRVKPNGKLYASGADISGKITASTFIATGSTGKFKVDDSHLGFYDSSDKAILTISAQGLAWGDDVQIPKNKVEGLSTIENTANSASAAASAANAVSATVTYARSNQGTNGSSVTDWSSSIPAQDASKPYLWTKTVTTYASGSTSTAYSVAYQGKDGSPGSPGTSGKYITRVTPLFFLHNTDSSAPSIDTSIEIHNDTVRGHWTTKMPVYDSSDEITKAYKYYYKCEKYVWSDNSITFSGVVLDYGMSYAITTATTASIAAASASSGSDPFTGTNIYKNYPWHHNIYDLAITSSADNKEGLLIGSNTKITIVGDAGDNEHEAMVFDSGGIALHGSTINLTTTSNTNTNVIALNPSSGITLASTAGITMASGGISMTSGSINMTSGNISLSGGQVILGTAATGATINGNKIDVNGVGGYVHLRTSEDTFVYLDPGLVNIKGSATSQVIINSTGITMAGNQISINGRVFDNTNLFARDDIIFGATFPNTHPTDRDWIWIKPYSNALITYTSPTGVTCGTTETTAILNQNGSALSFGNNSNWYEYTITFSSQAGASGASAANTDIYLSTTSNFNSNVVKITIENVHYWDNIHSYTGTIRLNTPNTVNLCQEGTNLYMKAVAGMTILGKIFNITLTCTTDATTSQVPCTVYYFPAPQS